MKQDVDLAKLPCQKIDTFHSSKTHTMPGSFQVDEELFSSAVNREHHENIELVTGCLKSAVDNNFDGNLPIWAGIRALLSNANAPQMHVAVLPFIPRSVTEHPTVYTAMRNFVKIADQLEQKSLPLFCDEGVFRIVVDIFLQHPLQFQSLVPCLGGFHMAKCAQHCIGKYIRGSGLEDSLLETSIFGIKIVEQFLNGTHYVRSLRGILILAEGIETIKWHAFWKIKEK